VLKDVELQRYKSALEDIYYEIHSIEKHALAERIGIIIEQALTKTGK